MYTVRPGYRVTAAKYSPPLSRNDFENLRDVAEVSEIIFKHSGKRVLLAWHPRASDNYYTEIEPGWYLAYDHQLQRLYADEDEYLQKYVKEEK
jgi:hypothetical protein